MKEVVIENPVLNSPYEEPKRHFVFDQDGITDEISATRRLSSYFLPIPPPKKKGGQAVVQGDWLGERIETNDFVNRVRARVEAWRSMGHPSIPRPAATAASVPAVLQSVSPLSVRASASA